MTKSEKIAEAFAFIEESPAQALANALAYEEPRFRFSPEREAEVLKAKLAMEQLQVAHSLTVAGVISAESVYALVKTAGGIE